MQIFRFAGLFFLAFAFPALPVSAQFSGRPSAILDTIPQEIYASMKSRLKADNESIAAEKSKVKSLIKTLQNDRFEYVVNMFNDDKIMVSSSLNSYLSEILNAVLTANPEIPRDVSLYIERHTVANATSYGEGTIIISLALLTRLENEQQVAFVISHELAHYYLRHTHHALYRYADLNFDKNLNREARDIRNSRYGNYTRMREFMKGIELGENRHSRTKEFEADELGLRFFLESRYADVAAPVRTMEILDSVDREHYQDNLDFKKYFNFKEFPFKASWINYKRPDMWQVKEDDSDTIRTHPSCLRRAAVLSRQLADVHLRTAPATGVPYEGVRKQAGVDLIESNYHFKKYGRALFDALVMSEQYPDDVWLHAMIGRCLYQLYSRQAAHELSKSLEQPGLKHDENYDRFLTFIHQLRLSELERLAYQYAINQKEAYYSDEDFLFTVWLCSHLKISKLSAVAIEEEFREKFPASKYLPLLK
jgi:Zn-dependent protease with chaperone function